ncbi:DUF2497 domain-containing protein [Xanthobacter sp. TB0136]|uniref:DUF2497 domain-containing protein n=1 Tax=Xanthobacter sp. TB0136 TaxID=3459177 RepID=UPI00403966D9
MPVQSKAKEPSIDEILDSIRRIIADEELAPENVVQSQPQVARPYPAHAPVAAATHVAGRKGGQGRPAPVQPERQAVREPRYAPIDSASRTAPHVSQAPVREPARQAARYQSATVRNTPPEVMAERPTAPAGVQPGAPAQGVAPMNSTVSSSSGPKPQAPVKPSVSGAPSETRHPPVRRDLLSPAVDAAVAAAFQSLGDLVLPQQERTVEDLVKEILRPMLKEWLDQNLAGIVEQLVRAEIQRVTANIR